MKKSKAVKGRAAWFKVGQDSLGSGSNLGFARSLLSAIHLTTSTAPGFATFSWSRLHLWWLDSKQCAKMHVLNCKDIPDYSYKLCLLKMRQQNAAFLTPVCKRMCGGRLGDVPRQISLGTRNVGH